MKIIVLDQTLTQRAILSSWVEATFIERIDAGGIFEIKINANSKQASNISIGQIVYLEADICGYINRIERTSHIDKSEEMLIISGISLKDTISSRITFPPSGEESYTYTQTKSDDIARDLLDKLIVNPIDTRKAISFFRLGDSNGNGSLIDFSTRLKPLDSQIYELLSEDKLCFNCTVDLEDKLAYLNTFKGMDRSIDQNDNPRAIFSLNMGTLDRSVTLQDNMEYKSVGYFGGLGEGITRTIAELPDSNQLSGLDRWETFVDISDAKTTDELVSKGTLRLSELDKTFSVSGDAKLNDKLLYSIGDFVTIKDIDGNYENVQITGITKTFSQGHKEQRELAFGKAPLTIVGTISNKLTGIDNVLTK